MARATSRQMAVAGEEGNRRTKARVESTEKLRRKAGCRQPEPRSRGGSPSLLRGEEGRLHALSRGRSSVLGPGSSLLTCVKVRPGGASVKRKIDCSSNQTTAESGRRDCDCDVLEKDTGCLVRKTIMLSLVGGVEVGVGGVGWVASSCAGWHFQCWDKNRARTKTGTFVDWRWTDKLPTTIGVFCPRVSHWLCRLSSFWLLASGSPDRFGVPRFAEGLVSSTSPPSQSSRFRY